MSKNSITKFDNGNRFDILGDEVILRKSGRLWAKRNCYALKSEWILQIAGEIKNGKRNKKGEILYKELT